MVRYSNDSDQTTYHYIGCVITIQNPYFFVQYLYDAIQILDHLTNRQSCIQMVTVSEYKSTIETVELRSLNKSAY